MCIPLTNVFCCNVGYFPKNNLYPNEGLTVLDSKYTIISCGHLIQPPLAIECVCSGTHLLLNPYVVLLHLHETP